MRFLSLFLLSIVLLAQFKSGPASSFFDSFTQGSIRIPTPSRSASMLSH
jgi:hypothetical protein